MNENMMTWQQYLAEQGAQLAVQEASGLVEVQGYAVEGQATVLKTGFVAPLTDLGLMQATGEDAASFLHNQLTNDVEHLSTSEARLAAYCSPKGRMTASFLYWKTDAGIFLQLSRDIQPAIQKRLQMFILRAKAKLADVSEEYAMLGVGGAAATTALQAWFPALPAQAYAKTDSEFGSLIRVPSADEHPRYQWIVNTKTAQSIWPALIEQLKPVNTSAWRLTEIKAALPRIIAKTQDQFVPQMVNFEVIGGVNFKKGCYPGQEIVARSQYLGKLKRRVALVSVADTNVSAGMEVFAGTDASQPCGMIVNAEKQDAHNSLCLVELKIADRDSGDVRLSGSEGPQLQFLPLPYELYDVTE